MSAAPRAGTRVAEPVGVSRPVIASSTLIALVASACAGDRPWPAHPVSVTSRELARRGKVATIDVLPLDFRLWAEPDFDGNLETLRSGAEANIMNAALETLSRRNFTTTAVIDWNGAWSGGTAMSPDDLLATVASLGQYGAAASRYDGVLPEPFLPARLGTATGADATLYLGGWGYVTQPEAHDSTAAKIATGVVVALVVVTVVALFVAAPHEDKSSHKAGHHGGGGGSSGGGGGVSQRPLSSASHSVAHLHRGVRAAAAALDAVGRTAIDIGVATTLDQEPVPTDEPPPHDSGKAQMYLEMTLVDNRTGLALWHARQLFPADAASPQDTARAARTLIEQLPGRALPVAAAQ